MIGETTELLPSSDAVIGLRNGALALYRQPVAFAVSDPATSTVFRWKPAAGVTVLTTRQSTAESLKLGFQFGENKDVEWGLTIVLSKGTCYWIFRSSDLPRAADDVCPSARLERVPIGLNRNAL